MSETGLQAAPAQIGEMMRMHRSLMEAGAYGAARKQRYALHAYMDTMLEDMAVLDGGRKNGAANEERGHGSQIDIEDQIDEDEADAAGDEGGDDG